MRNTPLTYLACACLILSAFLCGLFLGRSIDREVIRTEEIFTEQESTIVTTPAAPTQVNINTADLSTLMTLEGIGEVYAQRIIDYRTENGPFANIADITKVPGIGAKRFEVIMDKITIGG